METEKQTNTQNGPDTGRPQPRLHRAAQWMVERGELAALTVYWSEVNAATHRLSEADLQSIIQQAYDMFGMVAVPSYGREAGRSPAEVVLAEEDNRYGPLAKWGPVQDAHNTGVRA